MMETRMETKEEERQSFPGSAIGDREKLLKEYSNISLQCEEKISSKDFSPLHYTDLLDNPFDYSSIDSPRMMNENEVNALAEGFDNNRDIQQLAIKAIALKPTKLKVDSRDRKANNMILAPDDESVSRDNENLEDFDIDGFDENCDIRQLATKAAALQSSSACKLGSNSGSKKPNKVISAPDKKYVFQDKENFEGKRSIDSKNKKKKTAEGGGKWIQQKLVKSEKRVEGLKSELRARDEQLAESQNLAGRKEKELEEMAQFVSTLEDLLLSMSSHGAEDEEQNSLPRSPSAVDGLVDVTSADQATLDDYKVEVINLKGRVAQLIESLGSQGYAIDSLKSLNANSERTIASLMCMMGEKEQAISEMSDFNNMNDCANRKLLTHATEKHQKALGETRMKHKNEMNNLQKKNIHLLQDLSNQSRFIASLKSLNSDFGQTIASMVNLISEKDQAIADMANFNDMNDRANKNLLVHANKRHADELRAQEINMKNLLSIISMHQKEKYVFQQEVAMIKLQMEGGSDEMNKEYVEELKFLVALVAVMTVLMALVWEKEWFVFITPLYFLFVFYNLE